jgi:hypothetical protein
MKAYIKKNWIVFRLKPETVFIRSVERRCVCVCVHAEPYLFVSSSVHVVIRITMCLLK